MKKKFRCLVCGYVHEGDSAPEKCPQCNAPASKFVEIKEEAGKSEFISLEDFRIRTKASKTVIETLRNHGCLQGLPETNQLSLF